MELNDALRIALAPSDVWDALQDLALLRASLDNCESFIRLAGGEYALTLMVPLGPLRARYEVRAHVASKNATEPGAPHRDDFFTEFCAVVQAKHGQGPNRARGTHSRRQHVFLRPINLGGMARRVRPNDHGSGLSGRATSTLFGARASHSVSHREPTPHAMPQWAWAVMILLVAVLMYAAHWFTQS
jgi:hypothetical protein